MGSSVPSAFSTGGISFPGARSDDVWSLCANNSSKLIKPAGDLAKVILYMILRLLSRVNSTLEKCINGFALLRYEPARDHLT